MAGKVAFLFPGQGSQAVGMGQELASLYPQAQAVYTQADAALGFSLQKLCAEGPAERLQETANTQPALVATSLAVFAVLTARGITCDLVAGHSVGEYAALVAAGVLPLAETLKVVRRRGELMAQAVPTGGAMAAILGLEAEAVQAVCAAASVETGELVAPANYNCPGQIVISGMTAAVTRAGELARGQGAKVIPLAVSGPFHTELMAPAARQLEAALTLAQGWQNPQVGFIANVSADYLEDWQEIRTSLVTQLSSPVRWQQSIERMLADGVTLFVELGSGRVLSGLVRKINREAQVFAVEDAASLQKLLAFCERR